MRLEASSFVKNSILFSFADRRSALAIVISHRIFEVKQIAPGGIMAKCRLVIRERRLFVATHVDSRLFWCFSSRHFRLKPFVRFKGNLARPKAICPESGFKFPPSLPSMMLFPIWNPFPSEESRASFKGDPRPSIDCGEKLIRAFLPFEEERYHPVTFVNCTG